MYWAKQTFKLSSDTLFTIIKLKQNYLSSKNKVSQYTNQYIKYTPQKMTNTTMEIRIWEGSGLVGKTVEQIDKEFGIEIIKVARGEEASNPGKNLKIEPADYISYVGNSDACLKLFKKSAKS